MGQGAGNKTAKIGKKLSKQFWVSGGRVSLSKREAGVQETLPEAHAAELVLWQGRRGGLWDGLCCVPQIYI